MAAPLRDRPLTDVEFERLRLILSTFRDGSGQVLVRSTGKSMPGFRDFERATAVVCGGETAEDKGIFDVLVPTSGWLPYGISCKMTVVQPAVNSSSFMELSNSAKKFADEFRRLDIDWTRDPAAAGLATVRLVTSWHRALAGEVDLEGSRFFVLSHDRQWRTFQVLVFPLDLELADPLREVMWCVEGRASPSSIAGYIDVDGRRHRLWQLFPNSGGQLKYYPPLGWADWISPPFRLEQPPVRTLQERAQDYFPGLWRS
ncbi:hypothetical protein [Micromonospora sp. NPDC023888]|uniref:hypothetical protein n=1 Tax=Micromonospora sp. NPDC023888 TaxID=3155607 RepID=UPI0033E26BB4